MATETSSAVRARIEMIERRYSQLSEQQARLGLELQKATHAASQLFLENDDMSGAQIVSDLETKGDLISRALEILVAEKAACEFALKRAAIREHRQAADNLRAEVAELNKKTGPLLKTLSRIEDVEFSRHILESQRAGSWSGIGRPANEFDNPAELFGEPVGPNKGHFTQSRSRRLLDQAAELERLADQIDGELTGV